METDAAGLARLFGGSWRLLVRNPLIVVPSIAIGLVAALLEAMVHPLPYAPPADKIVGTVLEYILQLLGAVASIAVTTGMAAAAWQAGRATLADGWGAFARDGGQVTVALVGLLLIATGAGFLAPFTFGLSSLAFGFFCLYVMPAVIVHDRRGFAAIRESWKLAYDHILATLGIALALFLVLIVVGVIAALLSYSPQIGPFAASIVAALLAGTATAYATLVIVGEYLIVAPASGVA